MICYVVDKKSRKFEEPSSENDVHPVATKKIDLKEINTSTFLHLIKGNQDVTLMHEPPIDGKKMAYIFQDPTGTDRLTFLVRMLKSLRQQGTTTIVLTRGHADWTTKLLGLVGLLEHVNLVADTSGVAYHDGQYVGLSKDLLTLSDDSYYEIGKDRFCMALHGKVLYVDDNLETTTLTEDRVVCFELEQDGPGIDEKQADAILIVAEPSIQTVVFDFDCTITSKHAYKLLSNDPDHLLAYEQWLEQEDLVDYFLSR